VSYTGDNTILREVLHVEVLGLIQVCSNSETR
jgi:hypothetical protein